MRFTLIAILLLMGCASAPTDSFENCVKWCGDQRFSTANYVIIDNGLPCKKCKCYKSLHEALEEQ